MVGFLVGRGGEVGIGLSGFLGVNGRCLWPCGLGQPSDRRKAVEQIVKRRRLGPPTLFAPRRGPADRGGAESVTFSHHKPQVESRWVQEHPFSDVLGSPDVDAAHATCLQHMSERPLHPLAAAAQKPLSRVNGAGGRMLWVLGLGVCERV